MLTEKEKEFAEWLAKEVVGILKKDGVKPNDIVLDKIIATAIKNITKKTPMIPTRKKSRIISPLLIYDT